MAHKTPRALHLHPVEPWPISISTTPANLWLTTPSRPGDGRVVAAAVPQLDFVTPSGLKLIDQPMRTPPSADTLNDDSRRDWCVGIEWLKTLPREQAVLQHRSRVSTVARICTQELADELKEAFAMV